MNLNIKGKRALVMGASTGIGRAIAAALIAEGVDVAICARDQKRLEEATQALGAKLAVSCDLAQPGAAIPLVKKVEASLGGVDILIVNTGGPAKGKFDEITTAQWQAGFQNLWLSAVEAINGVLPGMKTRRWGRISIVTSVAAKEPMPALTVSNGLRAGLLGLTKSVCQEIAPFGITINALLPGYTDTERLRELGIAKEKITAQIPAGRLAHPDEFAAMAAFLSSEQAGYVTGQAIAVDGGYLRGL